MSEEQKAELSEIIAAGPEKANFDSGIRQASMVVQLVRDRYGVPYSASNM